VSRHEYTGQEVLNNIFLTNLNGRIYSSDGHGIFLSPDPRIPDPTNTQEYDRYSYVDNNPLTFVDPTGFDARSCMPNGCGGGYIGSDGFAGLCQGNCSGGVTTSGLTPAEAAYLFGNPFGTKSGTDNNSGQGPTVSLSDFMNSTAPQGTVSAAWSWLKSEGSVIVSEIAWELNNPVADFKGFLSDYASGVAKYGPGAAIAPVGFIADVGIAVEDAGLLAGSIRNVNLVGGTMNCVSCATAVDATLGGAPASAILTAAQPISVLGTGWAPVSGEMQIGSILSQSGNGARGIVFGESLTGDVGHVWNAVNQGGTINFIDGQLGGGGLGNFGSFQNFQFLLTHPSR
jgi:RHS repeat-associated protein